MSTQDTGLKPTRRTLVKGAAWSVPVVAVAGAAPAFAASPIFEIIGTTVGCKISNQKVYHLEITFENTGNQPDTITNVVISGMNSSGGTITWPAVPDQCMCPGSTWVLVVNSTDQQEEQGTGNIASFGANIQWSEISSPMALNIPDNTPDCSSEEAAMYDESHTAELLATWIHIDGPTGCTCA